jgi:N-acetylmuramoyl-L-alanine amidase
MARFGAIRSRAADSTKMEQSAIRCKTCRQNTANTVERLSRRRNQTGPIRLLSIFKLTFCVQCVSKPGGWTTQEAGMQDDPPPEDAASRAPTRRALLATAVTAGYLLPAWMMHRAEAAQRKQHHTTKHTAPAHQAATRRLVMLDPGHGGKDPGAIGVSGTYEKHISLATAFELKRQLESTGLYEVMMTRQSDVFIPLEDRVHHAQKRDADLFVSMHADALTDHEVRGASVYTLASRASDAQTAQLARRENSADRFGPNYRNQPPEVAAILDSLTRTETRIDSARLAHDVVGAFRHTIPILENPARHAEFVVLKAADIPSVLVEMGFMSNPADEAALRLPAHRVRVAAAMKTAVDAYFATAGALTRMEG